VVLAGDIGFSRRKVLSAAVTGPLRFVWRFGAMRVSAPVSIVDFAIMSRKFNSRPPILRAP